MPMEVLASLMTSSSAVSNSLWLGHCANDPLLVKYGRQNSIHVSPTVLFNGLVANDVSSSWGEAEWSAFLEKNVKS
jgi:hypothetical protein